MFTSFNDVSLRLSSLTCLPVVTPRLHELRRRLATAFFFDKAALSESHPDRAVHFKDILLRLEDSVFRPTHDTDFHELGAYVSLLNLAVDAGYLWDADSEMERQRFDEAIDVLAAKLYLILSKITEAGGIFIARTETKTMLSLVAVRLLCSVRLKPKRKKRVYDVDYFEADDGITMQQNYMKKFLGAARSDENVRET